MKKKYILLPAVAVILLAGLLFSLLYVAPLFRIRQSGIVLTPSRDIVPVAAPYYLQNDPAWAAESIGASGYSMADTGCLVSCVASAVSVLDATITPGELNEQLTAADGYDNADLLWYKLHEINPNVEYQYKRVFSATTLENDLTSGRLPVVKVKMHHTGATHWVLVVGAQDGEFWVMDPLQQDKTLVPLSEHGAVFAYRAIVPTTK